MAKAHAMGSRDVVWREIQKIDAELAPILAAEEERYMTARGYVRGTDEPGKRWVKPFCGVCNTWHTDCGPHVRVSETSIQTSDCNCRQPGLLGGDCDGSCQHPQPPAKSFWCTVALDYDKDEAWILNQSQDARDCDLLDGPSGDDNGLTRQKWVKSAVPGLYKLYLRPWSHQDLQGEWDTGADVSIVELLVAFPPRLCDDEGCPHHGTAHVCVSKEPVQIPDSGEPVAWSYELANAKWFGGERDGQYCDWKKHLTVYKPNVPAGSIRNLRPLYAGAVESQS